MLEAPEIRREKAYEVHFTEACPACPMKSLLPLFHRGSIFYLAKEGQEAEVVELAPGINAELNSSGDLIGVEVFNASSVFKDVIQLMEKRLQAA